MAHKKPVVGPPSLYVQSLGPQDASYWKMEIEDLFCLYNKLGDCCVLDFKSLRFAHDLSLTTDGGFLYVISGMFVSWMNHWNNDCQGVGDKTQHHFEQLAEI
ncbi:hypothetical protein BKA82DRAFT_991801, partial [Pisolithus tinctorius]